ncbi:hypothetical protein [Pseudomonas baltica]|uniref:hypothetical protein n=1 Tax=Pseudomonas baltica TaxID=2762576 RepID=UPI0028A13DF8|nr:hypothetical protein [Pseudomonas baltica]
MGHSVHHKVFRPVQALDAEIINLLEAVETLNSAKSGEFAYKVGRQALALLQVVTRLRTVLAEHPA